MELELLNFEYNFDEKKFYSMMYSFNSQLPNLNEKSVDIGNDIFRELGGIIDKVYLNTSNIQKIKKKRKINSDGISWGFSYTLDTYISDNENDSCSQVVGFIGKIGSLWFRDKPQEIFSILNTDTSSERVLNLYDLVINIPKLTFSDTAKLHKNQINYIRKMDAFNLNNYLNIK
jgi:hypothetical protein